MVLLLAEAWAVEIFNIDVWLPCAAVGIAIFLAIKPPFEVACTACLISAWFADLLAVSPPGTRALSITTVFFLVKLGGARLEVRSFFVKALVAVAAALFALTMEVCVVVLIGAASWHLFTSLLFGGVPAAVIAPIGLLVAWTCLERVDRFFTARHERSLGTIK